MNAGIPKYKYHVAYPCEGQQPWYIILTSTGVHFYYNEVTKESYWQLSDLYQIGVDKSFTNYINYDDVSTLVGLVNGLEIQSQDEKKRKKSTEVIHETHLKSNDDAQIEEEEISDGAEIHEEDDETLAETNEAGDKDEDGSYAEERDAFISDLLKDEGFIQSEEEGDKSGSGNQAEVVETEAESKGTGLDLGYSSSEDDEDEDEVEGSRIEEVVAKLEKDDVKPELKSDEQIHDSPSETEATSDVENDLDLDISDEGEDGDDSSSAFFELLDQFESKISVHDPWFLVEEELLDELVLDSRYYGVDSKIREDLYNRWIEEKADSKKGEINKNDDEFAFAGSVPSETYPTSTQLYFKFLQENKEKTKLYYSDFKRELRDEIQNFLASHSTSFKESDCENFFRQYSLMIRDFRAYEKAQKKKVPKSDTNLKKKKLADFLRLEKGKLFLHPTKHLKKDGVVKFMSGFKDLSSQEDIDEEKSYRMWFFLCNYFGVPKSIANDVTNYIVGPTKRVECYYEIFNELYK